MCVFVCVCVCVCLCARARVGLVHKNRFNCPSCFKSYRTMLDLAQHRCSAAAKNQVGVSVSECVCGRVSRDVAVRKGQLILIDLDVMVRMISRLTVDKASL